MSDSEEELDPRIVTELERLNTSSADINRLEKDLEDVQKAFVVLSRDAGSALTATQKRVGNAVDKARPYYQLKHRLEKAQNNLHAYTQEYERYMMGLDAASEMLQASEDARSASPESLTCQTMVTIARRKVSELSEQLAASKAKHGGLCSHVTQQNTELLKLKQENSKAISKAEPYFKQYDDMCQVLEAKKKDLTETTSALAASKNNYSDALTALENISNEIHRARSTPASIKRSDVCAVSVKADVGNVHVLPVSKSLLRRAQSVAVTSTRLPRSSHLTVSAISHDSAIRLKSLPLTVKVDESQAKTPRTLQRAQTFVESYSSLSDVGGLIRSYSLDKYSAEGSAQLSDSGLEAALDDSLSSADVTSVGRYSNGMATSPSSQPLVSHLNQ